MFRTLIACALTVATAGAFAQSGLTPSVNPDNMYAHGGQGTSSTIVFTNSGPGFASNIVTTFTYVSGSRTNGARLFKELDTCNGATVASGGTCKVTIQFDDACPAARGTALQYSLTLTTASGQAVSVPVWGNSQGGVCY
jgi:hypothetical protein